VSWCDSPSVWYYDIESVLLKAIRADDGVGMPQLKMIVHTFCTIHSYHRTSSFYPLVLLWHTVMTLVISFKDGSVVWFSQISEAKPQPTKLFNSFAYCSLFSLIVISYQWVITSLLTGVYNLMVI
jgi:hypothetical protein